jgi:hypothetical protein
LDLGVYLAVLRRHRVVMAVGLIVGLALAAAATTKLSETYSATSQLLVTQQGFPVGRTNLVDPKAPRDTAGNPIPSYADPSRFEYLAQVYARLAVSDVVKHRMLDKDGVDRGKVLVLDGGRTRGIYTATVDATDTGALPFIVIVAKAASGPEAREIASRATEALKGYITSSQEGAGIQGKDRVELQEIQAPTKAKLESGRALVLPVAILVLVLGAAAAVAFFRDNVSRTRRSTEADAKPLTPAEGDTAPPARAEAQPARLDIAPTRVAAVAGERSQGAAAKQPRKPPARPARPLAPLSISGDARDDGVGTRVAEEPALRDTADASAGSAPRVAESGQAPRDVP